MFEYYGSMSTLLQRYQEETANKQQHWQTGLDAIQEQYPEMLLDYTQKMAERLAEKDNTVYTVDTRYK
jgi:uncharacterized Zn finger protein